MDLTPRMKNFPAGRPGVLLPLDDRATAALGVCMYTASRPRVLAAQRAAFRLARRLGARALPGRAVLWNPPCGYDEWNALVKQWRDLVGGVDGFAAYQRRHAHRGGLTLLLTNRGEAVAVVKVRTDAEPLEREQTTLAQLGKAEPSTFRTPAPLGIGSVADDLHWSAQSAVFSAPHRPELDPPDALFDELADALAAVQAPSMGRSLAHNDMTPWNLRRDVEGRRWLFDWEDCAPAPIGADLVYFAVAAHALAGRPIPDGLPHEAIGFWRDRVARRTSEAGDAAELAGALQHALDIADAAAQ